MPRRPTRGAADAPAADAATVRLRATVRTFLETGGSSVETASRPHSHRNTVRSRSQRAEEIRGRPLEEDRIDLEVALVAGAQLGAWRPPVQSDPHA